MTDLEFICVSLLMATALTMLVFFKDVWGNPVFNYVEKVYGLGALCLLTFTIVFTILSCVRIVIAVLF